jgi:hypothetical protein
VKKFDITVYEEEDLVKLKGKMTLTHTELGLFIETLTEIYNEIQEKYYHG